MPTPTELAAELVAVYIYSRRAKQPPKPDLETVFKSQWLSIQGANAMTVDSMLELVRRRCEYFSYASEDAEFILSEVNHLLHNA